MWQRLDADVKPGATQGLPLMALTDTASILYRAELADVPVPRERWIAISDYAAQFFPNGTTGFADVHAALAHAMVGNYDALAQFIHSPNALTGDLVTPVAQAYAAISRGSWAEAVDPLTSARG